MILPDDHARLPRGVSLLWERPFVDTYPTDSAKRCGRCGLVLPLEQFRRRKSGCPERHSDCNACHGAYQQRRRRIQRARGIGEYIRRINLTESPSKADAVTRAMMQQFGGLDGLVTRLVEWYRLAVEREDLSSQLRFFSFVARLMECSALAQQAAQEDPAELSDEVLDQQIKQQIRDEIRRDPAVVLKIAAELEGWTVLPPAGTGVSPS